MVHRHKRHAPQPDLRSKSEHAAAGASGCAMMGRRCLLAGAGLPEAADHQHGDIEQQSTGDDQHPVLAGQAEPFAILGQLIQHGSHARRFRWATLRRAGR